MAKINVSKSIAISADIAWKKLSSFKGLEDYSPIARTETTGEGVGATRKCFMPDNAEINETLLKVDNEAKTFQYNITKGPFPFENYLSTVSIKDLGSDKCEISWGATYDVAAENEVAMEELLSGFYGVIIESLESFVKSESLV